jgi:uncharacterized membrane-anchored protein YitT (DUF2179 family)
MTKKGKNDRLIWQNIWNLKNLLQIIAGSGMAVLAMKGFMMPNHFLDGGVRRICLL